MKQKIGRPYGIKEQAKGFGVFLIVVIVFVVLLAFNAEVRRQNETIPQGIEYQEINTSGTSTSIEEPTSHYDLYIQNKKDVYYQEMVAELEESKSNKVRTRVLRGELAGKEEIFLNSFSHPEIGKYVISVLVAESGGGLHSCNTFNYSGIMKNGRCEGFDSLEDYIQNGIKKRTGVYFNRLHSVGVSEENLNNIFIGNGRYCTSGCSNWTSNFLATYNKL